MAGTTRSGRRRRQAGCTGLSRCGMESTNGQLCQKDGGSALPQVGKVVADHGVRQRRYLFTGQTKIEAEAEATYVELWHT